MAYSRVRLARVWRTLGYATTKEKCTLEYESCLESLVAPTPAQRPTLCVKLGGDQAATLGEGASWLEGHNQIVRGASGSVKKTLGSKVCRGKYLPRFVFNVVIFFTKSEN